MWLYQQSEFTSEHIQDYKAFVYEITNLITGKRYFGKKKFETYRRKKIKNRKNRKKIVSESDWADYYGSNTELLQDVEKYGKTSFKREILKLCRTLGESSYWEAKYILQTDAIIDDNFYNESLMLRVHKSHIKK